MVAIVALVSLLSGWLLKDIFQRPRPIQPLISGAGGYSFPSGHSLGGFTFSGVLIYLLWNSTIRTSLKWILSLALSVFALLIGLSRIYLRVHFASDVLGSLLVTIVWLSLTFIVLETIDKTNQTASWSLIAIQAIGHGNGCLFKYLNRRLGLALQAALAGDASVRCADIEVYQNGNP